MRVSESFVMAGCSVFRKQAILTAEPRGCLLGSSTTSNQEH